MGGTSLGAGLHPLLLPPHQAAPYRVQGRGGKNDANDAAAICEASCRPTIHPVAIKTPRQQAVLAAHVMRQGFVEERTALVNRERGVRFPDLIERADTGLPDPVRNLLRHALAHWIEIDMQIVHAEQPIRQHVRADPQARALTQRRNCTASSSSVRRRSPVAVGDFAQFKSARRVSAWLGVVPSQNSSGGRA